MDGPVLISGSYFKPKKEIRVGAYAGSTHRKKIVEVIDDISLEAEEDEEVRNEFAALSSLDSETVRWMNKHMVMKGPRAQLYRYHTTLAAGLPYKAIFAGLDTADAGDIELSDLEDLIKKLCSQPSGEGEAPLFDDPKAILEFFRQMDTDGGGTVDFGEFAVGMTNCPGGKGSNSVVRLQEAFMKYSTDIQRTAILNKATNPSFSDVDQYNAMKKLFEVPYAGRQDDVDVSTEDKIRVAYKRFVGTDKTIRDITNDDRQKEYQRSRAAKVYFDYDRTHRHKLSNNNHHTNSNHHSHANSNSHHHYHLRSPTDKQLWQSQAFNTGEAALLLSSLQQQQQQQQQQQTTQEQQDYEQPSASQLPPDLMSSTVLSPPSLPMRLAGIGSTTPSSSNALETGASPSSYPYPQFNPLDYSIDGSDHNNSSSGGNSGSKTETARNRAWQRHRMLLNSADPTVGNLRDPESILRKVTKKLSTRLKTIHMTDKYRRDAYSLPPLSSAAGNVSHAHHLSSPTYHHVRVTALNDVRKVRYGSTSDLLPPPRSSPIRLTPVRTPK